MMNRLIIVTIGLFLLAGCAIGPDYKRPGVETPPAWLMEEKEAKDLTNTAWWEQFNDPVLDDLVQTALQANKDLRAATARVEEFYGRYGATRANLFPQVGYDASGGESGIGNASVKSYRAEFSASWELDLWGRLRRATEAARADLMAAEESRSGLILSLVTAVATAYIDLRSLDRQLEIARQTAGSREESVRLFELRFKGGNISEMELSQVRSEYYVALAAVPELEKLVRQQENFISILLGRNPGPIPRGKTIGEITLPAVPSGLPSDLLSRRPDIRQAEQELIAANARIGVAKAQYFPTISLTGAYGSASTDLSDLFSGPSKAWNYTGTLTGPIFSFGRIKGSVRAAKAAQQQALAGYEQAIQNGFREVEDSLVDQDRTRKQLDAQGKQIDALATYARLARLRYENGYTSYIEVLDAERSLFNSQISFTQTQNGLFRALVNLYKAMGGGWVLEADQRTAVQAAAAQAPSESAAKAASSR